MRISIWTKVGAVHLDSESMFQKRFCYVELNMGRRLSMGILCDMEARDFSRVVT